MRPQRPKIAQPKRRVFWHITNRHTGRAKAESKPSRSVRWAGVNLKKNLQDGQKVSAFIRLAIGNELERLETYNKEKNQTWDLD